MLLLCLTSSEESNPCLSKPGSSLTFVGLLSNVKDLSSIKVWRGGSARTLWHTWSIRFAVMLRKWLCHNVTKRPFLHDKLCWRSYFALQPHIFGECDNGDPYRIFTRSPNSWFYKLYPSSFSGRVDSHVDTPLSWLILFKRIIHVV